TAAREMPPSGSRERNRPRRKKISPTSQKKSNCAYKRIQQVGTYAPDGEGFRGASRGVHRITRVSMRQLKEGSALRSQEVSAAAQELQAKTLLLQSQLEYVQANDEMIEANGTEARVVGILLIVRPSAENAPVAYCQFPYLVEGTASSAAQAVVSCKVDNGSSNRCGRPSNQQPKWRSCYRNLP